MKKLLVTLLLLSLTLTACSGSPSSSGSSVSVSSSSNSSSSSSQSSSEAKIYTLEDIAKENKAAIPEQFKPLYFDSGELGANGKDNKVGGMSFESIKFYETFDVGSQILKNVIAFDTASTLEQIKYFLENDCAIEVFDENGNSTASVGSAYYRDRANNKIYMIFQSETVDLSKYKFAILSGFLADKNNGNIRFSFEIEH